MLSYKHGYHAGNHADVLKHIVLLYLYNRSKKLNKSISYIETHSGNGLYKYTSKYMDKNKEYKDGIKKIEKYEGNNRLILDYLDIIKKITKKNNYYPGSPFIVSNICNKSDKLYFCELHINEHKKLKINLSNFTNIKIFNSDGFKYIDRIIDNEKSYFVLIDPSYEIKEDFNEIDKILNNLEKKYGNTKIIIWYPILNYLENDLFIDKIRKKGIQNLINLELPIKDDKNIGLKGSGLLLINFKERKIFNNLKSLLKELHFYLKHNDSVYNPKIRFL